MSWAARIYYTIMAWIERLVRFGKPLQGDLKGVLYRHLWKPLKALQTCDAI